MLTALPDPLAGFKGPTSRGGEKGKEKREKEGREKGEEMGGEAAIFRRPIFLSSQRL